MIEGGDSFLEMFQEERAAKMKKRKIVVLGALMISMALLLGGCNNTTDNRNTQTETSTENRLPNKTKSDGESWAYNYEPGTEVLWLGNDGSAVFKGAACRYEKDENYITLKAETGESLKFRYGMKKDDLVIYEATAYHYVSGNATEENPLIGLWQGGAEDRLSYEFTDKGTYLEDGIFPGHYSVDGEQGTIKLMYNDHFEDTYIYYSFDDGKLVIEYPWPMVKTQETDD